MSFLLLEDGSSKLTLEDGTASASAAVPGGAFMVSDGIFDFSSEPELLGGGAELVFENPAAKKPLHSISLPGSIGSPTVGGSLS